MNTCGSRSRRGKGEETVRDEHCRFGTRRRTPREGLHGGRTLRSDAIARGHRVSIPGALRRERRQGVLSPPTTGESVNSARVRRPHTWTVDLRHCLSEETEDLADMPGPALNCAMFFASIVAWATDHVPVGDPHTRMSGACAGRAGNVVWGGHGQISARLIGNRVALSVVRGERGDSWVGTHAVGSPASTRIAGSIVVARTSEQAMQPESAARGILSEGAARYEGHRSCGHHRRRSSRPS